MTIAQTIDNLITKFNLHKNFWILASFSHSADYLINHKDKNTKYKYLVYNIQIIPYTGLSKAVVTRLQFFNLPYINIIQVRDYFKNPEGRPLQWHNTDDSTDKNFIRFAEYTYPDFFNVEMLDFFFSPQSGHLDRTYFLFHSSFWFIIMSYFRYNKYIITGGSLQNRGIHTDLQKRVSRFLEIYQLECPRGFHGKLSPILKPQIDFKSEFGLAKYEEIKLRIRKDLDEDNTTVNTQLDKTEVDTNSNKFNSNSSKIVSPISPNSQNRKLHTLLNLKSTIRLSDRIPASVYNTNNFTPLSDKTRSFSSTPQILLTKKPTIDKLKEKSLIFNYLNSIKDILNNPDYTPEQAQEIIETSWIRIMEENIRESKDLIKKEYNKLGKLLLKGEVTLDLLFKHKTLKRKFPKFNEELNKIDHLLIAFSCGISFYSYLNFNTIAVMIGKNILYSIYRDRKLVSMDENFPTFKEWKLIEGNNYNDTVTDKNLHLIYENKKMSSANENFPTFTEWKTTENLNDDTELGKIGYFFISILSNFPSNIFERTLDREDSSTFYSPSQLKINEDIIDEIRENMVVHPSTLPMICKPVEWSDNSFGGFLDNKNKGEGLITKPYVHNHKVENLEPLYSVINYLNSIEFSINELLVNFLNGEGNYLLTEIKPDDELQQSITLKLAETFINKILYFNVKADWRGRIYTESFFLDYQGSDLASALLSFSEGLALTDSGRDYLYIYGANNHNQKNISKENFKKRIAWVKKNYNKIINLDKDLILSADNPFIFASFCLTMKELYSNPNYIVKTPVFLDATCNGMQHLAAMLQDLELGSKVNLTSFDIDDKPKDFYSEVIVSINKTINQYGEDNKQYAHFILLELTRLILKLSIMTKVYNNTTIGITGQVRSKLEKTNLDFENIGSVDHINLELKELIKNTKYVKDIKSSGTTKVKSRKNTEKDNEKYTRTLYIAPGKNGAKVHLSSHDIYKIAVIVNEVIFKLYPSLKKIYDYLLDISKLMIKLGIPLTWITPTGMKITQHYLISKRKTIPIQFSGHTNKMVLRERTDKLNANKQIGSIIPNTIHSLDSAHLMKLILSAIFDNFGPIISIHDCFGTHPNKMAELEFRVKKEFVLLYTKENFLETFHNRIIQSIIDNKYKILEENNEKFVVFENTVNKKLSIPNLPELGKLDLEKIIHSKYMIN